MLRITLALFSFLLIASASFGQLTGIHVEKYMDYDTFIGLHPENEEYPVNGVTYRIYAEFASSDAFVTSVPTIDNCDTMNVAANDRIWNSPLGGLTANQINAALVEFAPELEFDSFITIGRENSSSPGASTSVSAANPSGYFGLPNAWNTSEWGPDMHLQDGAWFVPNSPGNVNGLPQGANNRVLLAQVTTDDVLSYDLNLQVIFESNGVDSIYVNPTVDTTCFNGDLVVFAALSSENACSDPTACNYNPLGQSLEYCEYNGGCTNPVASNYDPDAQCDDGSCLIEGCTDELACNYDPDANSDDDSCIYPDGCADPTALNYNPNSPCSDDSCLYEGCLDSEACNYNPEATADDGSCVYEDTFVQGLVFYDQISDGEYNEMEQEPGLGNWQVLIQPNNEILITDQSGAFSFIAESGVEYTITLLDNSDVFNPLPSTQSLSLSGGLSCGVQDLYLGVEAESNSYDVQTGLANQFMPDIHCTDGTTPGIWMYNTGTLPLSGTITMTLDPELMVEPVDAPIFNPSSIESGVVVWTVEDVMPGEQALFICKLLGPGLEDPDIIGQEFPIDYEIVLTDNEGNSVIDFEYNTTPIVVCSYDPNDKLAEPVGYGDPHYILAEDEIEYRIRFQNLGNFPAEDVVLRDSLDLEHLDLATFTPRYASHNFSTCIMVDDGVVDFIFENIFLPDSSSDLEGSQGFVVFTVFPKADVEPEDLIENTAHIYFDENPPIATNTTWHTIYDCNELNALLDPKEISLCEFSEMSIEVDYPYIENYDWWINDTVVQADGESSFDLSEILEGKYSIGLTAANPLCSGSSTSPLTVLPIPEAEFSSDGANLTAASGEGYQWYLNGELIEGATEQSYTALENGNYSVEITNAEGCSNISSEQNIIVVGLGDGNEFSFTIYPNPTSDVLYVQFSDSQQIEFIRLLDLAGKKIRENQFNKLGLVTLDVSDLSSGQYFLQVKLSNGTTDTRKVLIQ